MSKFKSIYDQLKQKKFKGENLLLMIGNVKELYYELQ